MHIAIIADPIDKQSAGIHYYTKNLITYLLALDKKNTYTIVKLNAKPIRDDIPSIALGNRLSFLRNDPIRTFITLPRLLNQLKPDVVVEPAHFGPFRLHKDIKRVTVIHDLTPIKFPRFHRFSSQLLQRLFLPAIVRKADLLITNSKNTSQDLLTTYPHSEGKIKSIYLGKADIFKPTRSEEALKHYKITSPYFFTVSTIEPRKNLTTLLNAYELFRRTNNKKIGLAISGGIGWKSKTFFKTYFNHPYKDDIRLIGYVNRKDMPALYSQAETFIFPSFYEGFGLPVLEAMACGTPCITSNTSSLPEVCEYAALHFDPFSAEELAKKMNYISENNELKEKLIERSLKQAVKFSWGRYAKEFIQALEEKFS